MSLAHAPDVLIVWAAIGLVFLMAVPQIRRERTKRPGGTPTASHINSAGSDDT